MAVVEIEGKQITLPDDVVKAGDGAIRAVLAANGFPAIENADIKIVGGKEGAPAIVKVAPRSTGKGKEDAPAHLSEMPAPAGASEDQQDAPRQEKPRIRFWDSLLGNRIVIQEKTGPIVRGRYVEFEGGYLKLVEAEVRGRAKAAQLDEIFVHFSAVAHVHVETQVSPVNQQGPGGKNVSGE